MGGRRLDGLPVDRSSSPPDGPARRMDRLPPLPPSLPPAGRPPAPAGGPATAPAGATRRPERAIRPRGPLAASPRPAAPGRAETEPPGRLRRFVHRYGWRAYAVPLLAVATVATLVDLVLTSPAETTAVAGSSSGATSAPSPADGGADQEGAGRDGAAADPPGGVPQGEDEKDAAPSVLPPPPAEITYVEQGEGSATVVDGESPVIGTGPLQRFVVEVEDGIEVDGASFADAVTAILGDPRSWGADGRMSFQRVGADAVAAGAYDFRVSLISPGSMETYCPGVGTQGYTSCRYGERAVINLARWATAVPHYDGDITTYRQYVVNHEVGHAIGNREHPPCPGAGELAPVMQQQTLGLDGCVKNAWPYP